MAPLNLKITS